MGKALRSMTGFGSAQVASMGVCVDVEVRSVNHRHLQAKIRLPHDLGALEATLDGLVRKQLSRGSVQLNVRINTDKAPTSTRVHEDVAAQYLKSLRKLAKALKLEDTVGMADLLRLPGVVSAQDATVDRERLEKSVLRAVKQALLELVEMREQEGAAMGRDLEHHVRAIAKTRMRIGRNAPRLVRRHHKELKRRVAELMGDGAGVTERDLARELALLADKLDVSEELSRLDAHLEQLERLLTQGGAVGRKLDFLAQEFNREANTIGSKCNDARMSHDVVELKTHIERLREQVQNVE